MTTFGGSAGTGASQFDTTSFMSKGTQFAEMANSIMDAKLKNSMIGKSEAEASYTRQKELTELENTLYQQLENVNKKYQNEKNDFMKKFWQDEANEIIARVESLRANSGLANSQKDINKYNLEKSKEEGLRTTDSKDARYNSAVAAGSKIVNGIGEALGGDGNNGFGDTPTPQNPPKDSEETKKLRAFQNKIWDWAESQPNDDNLLDKMYEAFKNSPYIKNMNRKKAKDYLMNLYLNRI